MRSTRAWDVQGWFIYVCSQFSLKWERFFSFEFRLNSNTPLYDNWLESIYMWEIKKQEQEHWFFTVHTVMCMHIDMAASGDSVTKPIFGSIYFIRISVQDTISSINEHFEQNLFHALIEWLIFKGRRQEKKWSSKSSTMFVLRRRSWILHFPDHGVIWWKKSSWWMQWSRFYVYEHTVSIVIEISGVDQSNSSNADPAIDYGESITEYEPPRHPYNRFLILMPVKVKTDPSWGLPVEDFISNDDLRYISHSLSELEKERKEKNDLKSIDTVNEFILARIQYSLQPPFRNEFFQKISNQEYRKHSQQF